MRSHARTAAWCEEARALLPLDSLDAVPLDLCDDAPDDAELVDMHELEGLLLALGATGKSIALRPGLLADPRLTAWQRLALAALEERAGAGRTSIMTCSEVADRVRPDADARTALEEAVDALRRRGAITRLAGGGFVLRWRVAA